MAPEEGRGEGIRQVVGRPLLVVFWALVVWGTLYCGVFLYAAFVDGPRAALERTLFGRDVGAGLLNLALAGLAVVVWSLVGVIVWNSRASDESKRREDSRGRWRKRREGV